MSRITYGDYVFEGDDIKSGNIYKARSLSCSVLEIDTLDVNVVCEDTNLKNFTKYDPLTYYVGETQVGVFYVDNIERIDINQYAISAVSIVGVLGASDHYGGVYSGAFAGNIIRDICAGVSVKVKSNIEKVQLYGHLPIASKRDNLSQVLLALGAYLKIDNNGVLRVEPLWSGVSLMLTEDDIFLESSVKYDLPVKSVIVTEHQYTKGVERVTLFEGSTQNAEIIQFGSPCHDLLATGFAILESDVNYARVSKGTGTITGIKYIHNTKEVTAGSYMSDETTTKVSNATLVSSSNSYQVANRLLYWGEKSEQALSDVIYEGQNAGDVASAPNAYSEPQLSCVQSLDITIEEGDSRAKQTGRVDFLPPEPDHVPKDSPAVSLFMTSDNIPLKDRTGRKFLA